jgi:hypothetical protein
MVSSETKSKFDYSSAEEIEAVKLPSRGGLGG